MAVPKLPRKVFPGSSGPTIATNTTPIITMTRIRKNRLTAELYAVARVPVAGT